jgi:peptidoglycan/LPS O-acetylase OafA/YrhL
VDRGHVLALAVQQLQGDGLGDADRGRVWDLAHFHPLGHVGTFVVGMCCARLCRWHVERWRRAAPWLVALGVLAPALAAAASPPLVAYGHNGLFAPAFAAIVLSVCAGRGRAFDVLASAPLQLLGEISYGIHILQAPVHVGCLALAAAAGWPVAGDAFFWPFCAVLLALAFVSYRWLETPARRAINGVHRRWHAARAAASPGA